MNDKYELVKSYMEDIWHFYIKDNLSLDFCAKLIMQDTRIKITEEEVAKGFEAYFKRETGIALNVACPICGGKTIPCKSEKGFFVGCSNFPKCEFVASKSRKYTTTENYLERLQQEVRVVEAAENILKEEGEKLYEWMQDNIKFVKSEKTFLDSLIRTNISISYTKAKRFLTLYKKMKTLGYPEKKSEFYKDKISARTEYIEKQVNLYYNKAKETRPQITKAEARKDYANIYKKLFGISYDDPCPNCNGLLCIRKQTRYDGTGVGHFIGCTNYPECGFSANSYRRFSVEDKSNA